jgi:hypothetical protein
VVVATIAPVDEPISIAAITAVDARGSQIAYLVETNPAGGTRIFEILLDCERGVGGFEIYNAAQGKVKRFLQKLTGRGERPAVDVPTDALRALIARVASRQPANRSAPRGFSEWRSRLTHGAEGAATPGALARESLGPVDAAGIERAVELVRARELGPWPPESPTLHETAERLVEIEKSELELSDAARREQIDGILDGAVMELYVGPFGNCCAERFEEMAYLFKQWDRPEDAGACLAAADAFRGQGPAEHPVARALLEVLLSPVIRRLEGTAVEAEK